MSDSNDYIRREGEPCSNCLHEAVETRAFQLRAAHLGPLQSETRYLCRVCATTFISKATQYPTQCGPDDVLQALGWVANELLNRIEELRKELHERTNV